MRQKKEIEDTRTAVKMNVAKKATTTRQLEFDFEN